MPSFYPLPAPIPNDIGSATHPIEMIWIRSGDAGKMELANNAIIHQLEEKTGFKFESSIAETQMDAIDAIGNGRARVAWFDALSYIVAKKRHNVTLGLVGLRNGKDSAASVIIINKATGITTLGDLRDKHLCITDRQSIPEFIVPNVILGANGVDVRKDLRVVETNSPIKTLGAIYQRDCDAGFVLTDAHDAFRTEFPSSTERIQILDTSPAIPNHAVAFASQFPADKRDAIVQALLDVSTAEQGKQLLATHPYQIDGLARRSDALYDRLRDLFTKAGGDVTSQMSR